MGSAAGRKAQSVGKRRLAACVCLARAALVATALALVTACVGPRLVVQPPPHPDAVAAFDEMRALERAALLDPTLDVDDRVRAALERAAAADPTWIAPLRLLDEHSVRDLRGPQRLAHHRATLARGGVTAEALYLTGRLEGAIGSVRFPMAVALAPDLAWPHHALSVDRQIAGQRRAAIAPARRAFERARSSHERAFFGRRLASLLDAERAMNEARACLEFVLQDGELDEHSRLEVELDLALLELVQFLEAPVVEKGYRRALSLLASGRTSRAESARLITHLRNGLNGRSEEAWLLDLEGALRRNPNFAGDDAYRDALARGDMAGVLATLRSDGLTEPWARLAAAFESGDERAAIEVWLSEQPRAVLHADGLPLDERLRAVIETARRADGSAAARLELLEVCFEAGWFHEVALLARRVDRGGDATDVERARDLERRALAAQALLAEIEQLLSAVIGTDLAWDLSVAPEPPRFDPVSVPTDLDLDGVLERIGALVERYADLLGWDGPTLRSAVARSSALRFGPFGAVVVPGPTYAERDELLGVGRSGERVAGLADVLDRLGRMGLFGQPPFGAVDGTILRRISAVERSGELLGAPWSGMVIHCDGVDARGRRSRAGLEISGAALHEGYWVDVGAERRRLAGWRALEAELAQRGESWAREVLAEFALPCDVGAGGELRFERARLAPALGADRVMRLALLLERSSTRGVAGAPLLDLDELLEVVETHEQGHLTDRVRFLPLGRNLLSLFSIAVTEVFSPIDIERRLEYRAELLALACVSEPRLVLVELLEAASVDERQRTVHAHAYRELLADFLEEWNRALEADSSAWPSVRRDHYLMHQMTHLTVDDIRRFALVLAEREGLVRRSASAH